MTRRAIQAICLALFVYAIYLTHYPFTEYFPVDAFLKLDPLGPLSAALVARAAVSGLGLALLMLLLTAIFGRIFCGWICPLGTLLDLSDRLIRGAKPRPVKVDQRWLWVKYVILAFLLGAAALGVNLGYLLDPIPLITRVFTYAVAPMVAGASNVGLDLLRPVFEKTGPYWLARTSIDVPRFGAGAALWFLVFIGIVAGGLIMPRLWCRVLCPAGALMGLFSRFSLIRRRVSDKCDQEGDCARRCPTMAIGKDRRTTRQAECIACQTCRDVCAKRGTDAVSFGVKSAAAPASPQPSEDRGVPRRSLIAGTGCGMAAGFLTALDPMGLERMRTAVRPPGALPEREFLRTCIRCGQCIKACVTNTLQPSGLADGLEGMFAPKHLMRLGGCDQSCNLCGQVCPTGAIRPLSMEQKRHAKIGTAAIDRGRCIVWEEDRACLICDEACPYDAIVFRADELGVRRPYVVEQRCNGCGLCEQVCPIGGRSAIRVSPHGEFRLAKGSYIELARERRMTFEPVGPTEDSFEYY
ncbi:MAG: 4Fe-4S binding protein [Candidatus Alcyoniella australis]|nr:4Fe-4S binding protein [Candidatus Alcyoniella australis]